MLRGLRCDYYRWPRYRNISKLTEVPKHSKSNKMDVIENSIWPGTTSAILPAYAIAPQQPSSTQGAPQVASAEVVTATTPSAATPNVGYNLAPTIAPTDTSTAVPMEGTIALSAYESAPADGKGGASGVGNAGGQVSVSGATVAHTEISGGDGDGDGEARMKEEVVTEGGEEATDGRSRPAKRPRDTPLQVGLPKSMVRRIMKLGEDTRNISNEALVIVVKASELFLERFAAQAFSHAEKLGRRTIKYQDVSDVRVEDPNLLFLEAVVPP